AGTDVNAGGGLDDNGEPLLWTPLHHAAWGGHKEIAELLIAKGAEVDANHDGEGTPLHNAAYGHKEIAELLIDEGADVNAKDDEGETPLDFAILVGRDEIADLLRKHGGKTGEELENAEPVAEASKPEPPTVKAPDISIQRCCQKR
ncbi:MAG: ankyrin repeat domain-containing protein, partial [Kiritimatiellia bacterium]|nr:ankyrin repeat domain-containing protein [Kiritimatiellia bacterium]